ncbi:Formyltransferase [Hygrophoropsis aurantiaca]|uniref:Formyltransferase n=1 Tax=Hygrophoropsis aurantiaca TaxID=72124 RepID=A0ACB8AFX8_9AGAM|nr:Formyltransferase [Hygrophoropsis aurantiaca]
MQPLLPRYPSIMNILLSPCRGWQTYKIRKISFIARSQFASLHTQSTRPFDILFFGRDEFSCLVLRQLHAARDVWGNLSIATNPDVKTGRRGAHLSISPLKTLGEKLELPVHAIPQEKSAFRHWLPPPPFSALPNENHLLITASFGRILPPSLLQLFPEDRRLNVHPSLLPAYRGPAPIQRALMAGDRESGVCIIDMLEVRRKRSIGSSGAADTDQNTGGGIDAGGIWGQTTSPIPPDAAFSSLRDTLADRGGKLLVAVLKKMLNGTASRTSQAPMLATTPRGSAITGKDASVNFETLSAVEIERIHRAIGHQANQSLHFLKKPITTSLPSGKTLQLHTLSVLPSLSSGTPGLVSYCPHSRTLLIPCAVGVLSVGHVKQQDRTLLAAREWWNGMKGLGLTEHGILLGSESRP